MDISHDFGSDLTVGPTGDIATVEGSSLGQQRVLRRLLTNAGDYIWQLPYGAGLPRFVGDPANAVQIQAIVRSQMFRESAIAASPEPTVDVVSSADGTVAVQIRYTDSSSDQTQTLSFSLDA